jgi:RimJ/RimL family protein N-acetyltransferase
MPKQIVYNYPEVYDFVKDIYPFAPSLTATGIGLKEDGQMIAGVLFEDYNGVNIHMHVAALPGRRWMTREYLFTCFAYPFVQLGCNRITGTVEASNLDARRFDEHLGFTQEALLKGAARDGGDVIIYVMFREHCRFIKEHKHGKQK